MSHVVIYNCSCSRFGSDVQMSAVRFDGYGKNFAKSIKQSPDALIQVINYLILIVIVSGLITQKNVKI